ncbi:hypothetical protein RchiOBHm_Chr1g0378421 [Rosa chinensis]|uniref:Uncharacterized protein n=1 Tax=Rosa chinensis TaxID=74649 RepID=A0A2P6SN97_ROSCH|nr:uncharacterized protein LOC112177260 [Rosa chinensis]PRQ60184.1 hypothetical protein RchiOBHm_Chr1g0378421 [Rosa chinensis]
MTVFSGEMSSESDDRSVLAPSETNAQGLSKRSRIRYTRSFLVSLANLSTEKGLPRGIEPSVLCELDFRLDWPLQASSESDCERCHENLHKGLLSSENVGLLGPGSLLGVHGDIADASPPKVEESTLPLLHKSKEPYRPPRLFKADWNDYKDEVWVSPEHPSKSEGQKQNWRRDFPEVMREEQKEAFQDKQKKNSNEHDENVKFIMPLEMPESDEIIDSLGPQHSDCIANHTNSPAICGSEFAHQFPAIEEKPAYGISCTEGSESIAHGISNEHSNKVPDEHLKSTTDETSEQLYGCKIPAVILGVLACIGLEHILKPETKEISCSLLWDGCDAEDGNQDSANHHGSHHHLLLPEKGTEQKDTTASSKLNIASDELRPSDSITDNNKLIFLSQGNAGQCEKDLSQEPSYGTSSTKGLQLTDSSSCIRQSSVGRATRKSVSKTCRFFFPVANKNHLASAISKYKPSVINSEDIRFSSSTDQSKGRENQSVSDDLKLNPVCCSDEKDTLPLELCLPDEDSLITVDDFRIVSYKDMLERNEIKADRVMPNAPVDSSRKPMDTKIGIKDEKSTHVYKSEVPVYQGKSSYRASPALINSQVKAVNPKFKPQNTSNRAFSTNVLPTTFHQSQAKPHQQLQQTLFTETVPTPYMPDLYHAQAFPWNYQMSSYGCVPVPTPGFQPYGGTNLLGTQSNALNAGTGYYLGWQ